MIKLLPKLHCTQCNKLRLWDDIKTYSKWFDGDGRKNIMQRNINYCVDNNECYQAAIKQMDEELLTKGLTYSECQNFDELSPEEKQQVRYA